MSRTFFGVLLFFIQPNLSFTHYLDLSLHDNEKPAMQTSLPPTALIQHEPNSVLAAFYAQLKAMPGILLSSEIRGEVANLNVKPGQFVNIGQVLVNLQCFDETAALKQQSLDLQQQEAIKQELVELHSINTLELQVAEIAYAEALAAYNLAKVRMDKCQIVAPVSGRVAKVFTKNSAVIQQGEPLLELIENNAQDVEILVPSAMFVGLKTGIPYTVNFSSTHTSYKIQLTNLGGKVDPVNKTIKMYGRIEQRAEPIPLIPNGKILVNPLGTG